MDVENLSANLSLGRSGNRAPRLVGAPSLGREGRSEPGCVGPGKRAGPWQAIWRMRWASLANPFTPNTETRSHHERRIRCSRDRFTVGPSICKRVRRLVAEAIDASATDHVVARLVQDPSFGDVVGVSLQPSSTRRSTRLIKQALARGGPGRPALGAPALPMRAVPKKPRFRDIAKKERLRMTPTAKRVLEQASKARIIRKGSMSQAQQVLAQILLLQPPDPAAVLLGALGVNTSDVRRRLDELTPDS